MRPNIVRASRAFTTELLIKCNHRTMQDDFGIIWKACDWEGMATFYMEDVSRDDMSEHCKNSGCHILNDEPVALDPRVYDESKS